MTNEEMAEFASKRIKKLRVKLKENPSNKSMLRERVEIYQGIIETTK